MVTNHYELSETAKLLHGDISLCKNESGILNLCSIPLKRRHEGRFTEHFGYVGVTLQLIHVNGWELRSRVFCHATARGTKTDSRGMDWNGNGNEDRNGMDGMEWNGMEWNGMEHRNGMEWKKHRKTEN